MRRLRTLARLQATPGNLSLKALAAARGEGRPISLARLIRETSKRFQARVSTPSPDALGGEVVLVVYGDGTYDLSVSLRNSGFPDYSFRLAVLLRSREHGIFARHFQGTAHGTLSLGSREYSSSETRQPDPLLKAFWEDFAFGQFTVNREYQNNLTAFVTSTIGDKLSFVASTVLLGGPATLIIVGSNLLGELTGARLPAALGLVGLFAAEGQYFLAGPIGFLPVFIAGATVTAALLKQRPMRAEEIALAEGVFKDTIPYSKITIANLSSLNGRAFAVPGIDGGFLIGAGPYYEDFVSSGARTLIHELAHAWQFYHGGLDFLLCNAVPTGIEARVAPPPGGPDRIYDYALPPTLPWSCYNSEQQANIVADWWYFRDEAKKQERNYPYTEWQRYIEENIRLNNP